MAKTKPRFLRLKIRAMATSVTKKALIDYLIASINRGDYKYPRHWRVVLGWSNSPDGDLKWGEFTTEMKKSAQSSPGWDIAVTNYLEALR
jgi:hypothetical protein